MRVQDLLIGQVVTDAGARQCAPEALHIGLVVNQFKYRNQYYIPVVNHLKIIFNDYVTYRSVFS